MAAVVSQFLPVKALLTPQKQEYEAPTATHVPPFLHGRAAQSVETMKRTVVMSVKNDSLSSSSSTRSERTAMDSEKGIHSVSQLYLA